MTQEIFKFVGMYCHCYSMKKNVENGFLDHKMDTCKSFVFPRQYRNCFSRRINTLVLVSGWNVIKFGIQDIFGFSFQTPAKNAVSTENLKRNSSI